MASPSIVTSVASTVVSMATDTAMAPAATPYQNATTSTNPTNGITGGYPGNNRTILRAMTAFTAIAWYNSIELIILCMLRFKKKTTLYFWSMLITSFFIIVYQIGSWGKMLQITNHQLITVTFLNVGWIFMVVGQSIVLYSRLHLITLSPTTLRFVLWMIVINSTLMYIPTTALTYGANVHPYGPGYVTGYQIMERIQMTAFTIQELTISGIYLWQVSRYLKETAEGHTRKLMWELFVVNVALIILDAALLSVEYVDLYEIETTLKGMVYSIKLKLELGVLSKLVKLVTDRKDSFRMTGQGEQMNLQRFMSSDTQKNFNNVEKSPRCPSETPPSERGPSESSSNNKEFGETIHHDFAFGGSCPMRAPTAQDPRITMPALIHQSSSRRSSISNLYPGKLAG